MPQNPLQKQRKYLKEFWTFVKPYKKPLRIVYILFFLNSALNLLPALSVRYYIDMVLSNKQMSLFGLQLPLLSDYTVNEKLFFSGCFAAGIVIVILIANSIGVTMHRRATRSVEDVLFDIKIRILNHINKLSLSFFHSERVGRIMTTAVGDVLNLSMMLRNSFGLTYEAVQFFLAPILMLWLSPVLLLVALLPLPFICYSFYTIRIRLKPMYKQQREHQSQINAQMQEIISGIREIKAFNMEGRSGQSYEDINRRFYDVQNQIMRTFSFNHQLQYGSKDFGLVMIAVLGGVFMLYDIGNVTIGKISAFLLLANHFYMPISMFLRYFDIMQNGMVSLERIIDFIGISPDIEDKSDAIEMRRDSIIPHVSYKNVCFSYTDNHNVLEDISFDVQASQKVALVGLTGSGKSTLISLLLRFYDVGSGSITIGGRDIRDFTQTSLHQNISAVFQETFLFHGTIRDNLVFVNPDRSDEDIKRACIAANIYDTILELPRGFDTHVGERGVMLSGGQKQRLAIARVLLKDPLIVVLDEATSSVDTITEKYIQEGVEKMLEGRTAFIIAHRLSTVRKCDKIIVLDNGQIAQIGTHEQLLANAGVYQNLYQSTAF